MKRNQASVNGSEQATPQRDAKPIPSRDPDYIWCARYGHDYDARSLDASRKRAERRERAKARPGKLDVVAEPGVIEAAAARLKSKRHLVELRLTRGFQWNGGPFAGSQEYRREAFTSHGLMSNRHPILKCFASKLHRAKHLRIGDDKSGYYGSDSKLLACDAVYVYANSKVCGVLRVEIDGGFPVTAVEETCRQQGVPAPNLVVGWIDAAGDIHNPHLIWLLHASLPMEGTLCRRFRGLYRGVLRGLTKALLSIGADPGGLTNCHKHKNPLCPLWNTTILAEAPYDLAQIAQSVDCTVKMADLVKMAETMHGTRELSQDHPDEAVAVGSNALFRSLASWARKEVVAVKAAGGTEQEFGGLVAAEACGLASRMTGGFKGERAALAVAKRVSRWTWNDYRIPQARLRSTADDAALAARRADGARIVSASRKEKSAQVILNAALQIRREGLTLTQVAVLARVKAHGVTNEKTVRRHWPAVLETLADMREPDIQPLSVKRIQPRFSVKN